MQLYCSHLSQIPGPHGVVESASPQLRAVWRNVYTASTVRVALELSANKQDHFNLNSPLQNYTGEGSKLSRCLQPTNISVPGSSDEKYRSGTEGRAMRVFCQSKHEAPHLPHKSLVVQIPDGDITI